MQLIIKNIHENQYAGIDGQTIPRYHHNILYALFPV